MAAGRDYLEYLLHGTMKMYFLPDSRECKENVAAQATTGTL